MLVHGFVFVECLRFEFKFGLNSIRFECGLSLFEKEKKRKEIENPNRTQTQPNTLGPTLSLRPNSNPVPGPAKPTARLSLLARPHATASSAARAPRCFPGPHGTHALLARARRQRPPPSSAWIAPPPSAAHLAASVAPTQRGQRAAHGPLPRLTPRTARFRLLTSAVSQRSSPVPRP